MRERLPSAVVTAVVLAAGTMFAVVGCGGTQVHPENRRLLEGLQTAVSAQNSEWLAAVNKQVADQKSAGNITDAEFQSFDAVIRQAQAGDWSAAQAAVLALSDAQRPTADDLSRVQKRKPAKRK
jgi:hypothetical protein